VDTGSWLDVAANDGTFDTDYEGVSFTTSSLTPGQHTIDVKATNSLGRSIIWSDTVTLTSGYSITVGKTGTGSGTVTSSPTGINCGSTCYSPFDNSTVVTLTAVAATGSTFTGWSGSGCSGTGTCVVTVDGGKSVSAAFTLETYLLEVGKTGIGSGTVTSSPAGIACGITCSYTFNYNTSVILTAVADSGSVFTGWSGSACAGTGTCTVSMTAARSVSASFEMFPGAFLKTSPAKWVTGVPTTITLSWGASAAAVSYEYCYDKTNDNACTGWLSNGASTSKVLSALSPNTTYYWHVRAVNLAGMTYANGSSTAFWSFKTGSLPAAFLKTSPATGSTNRPVSQTLKWAASTGATSYEYCYDTTNDSACSTSWVSNGTATSVVLNNLLPSTTYYWQVRAVSAVGTTYANGTATSFWNFKTGALPGTLNKSGPSDGAIDQPVSLSLSWTASTGAASYWYCFDTTNDNACTTWVSNGTATSKVLSGLASNTTYYWQVRATNTIGSTYANGSSTNYWSFTTGDFVALPGAFNKISPARWSTGLPTTLTLSWAASSGATSYQYCYDKTNNNACTTWISTGTSTSVLISSLSANTAYYWHVRAVNTTGTTYSNASSTVFWKFTTAQ
jgi:hypothetical protein